MDTVSILASKSVSTAAIDRGKQVIVSAAAPFSVGDHDFTKAKIIPSVIPEKILFTQERHVTLKDGTFKPSSPLQHCSELL